jgi:hypothetical protein
MPTARRPSMLWAMTPPRRFHVDVQVGDEGISGSVTDEEGQRRPFEGWLALIAALQPREPAADDSAAPLDPGGALG